MHVSLQIYKLVPANLPRVLIIWSKEFLFWRHLVYFSIVPSCKYSSSSRRCVYCRRSLKGEVCITRSDFSQSRLSPSLEPGELAGQKESSSSRFSLLLIHIHPTTCHTQNSRQNNFIYRKKVYTVQIKSKAHLRITIKYLSHESKTSSLCMRVSKIFPMNIHRLQRPISRSNQSKQIATYHLVQRSVNKNLLMNRSVLQMWVAAASDPLSYRCKSNCSCHANFADWWDWCNALQWLLD